MRMCTHLHNFVLTNWVFGHRTCGWILQLWVFI